MIDNDKRHIRLYGFTRELLLAEICRRLDIIEICTHKNRLNMKLEKVRGNTYRGKCRCCSLKKSYTIHRKTGLGKCKRCGAETDFIDLIMDYRKTNLASALGFIRFLVEGSEQEKAEQRRERRAARRSQQGGML